MIQDVFLGHTWAVLPHKFEAGTPAIGEAVGMGVMIRYLQAVGLEAIQAWEAQPPGICSPGCRPLMVWGPGPDAGSAARARCPRHIPCGWRACQTLPF